MKTSALLTLLLLFACSAPAEEMMPGPTTAGAPNVVAAGTGGSASEAGSAPTAGQAQGGGSQAGGSAGAAPVAGSPSGASGGQPVSGGSAGAAPVAGTTASADQPAQGGSSQGGQPGSAGAPAASACEPPTTGWVTDCSGKCPNAHASNCVCGLDVLGAAANVYEKWVVIKANSGTACDAPRCDGSVYGFQVWKGECGRFTSMPVPIGRTPPMFARNTVSGSPRCEAWSTSSCMISIGAGDNDGLNYTKMGNTYIAPGNVDAWVHAEASPLNADGSCPLACP